MPFYHANQHKLVTYAKPREINKPEIILQKKIDINLLSLGLSPPLHSCFFECMLHIS